MNPDIVEKFIDKNRDKILRIFSFYQIVEIGLFMFLYKFKDFDINNNQEIKKFNELYSHKTLGNMISVYKKKYPNDNYNLLKELEEIRPQRNDFMHSLWINLSVCKNQKEISKYGNSILNKYNKNITKVFHKVYNLKN